MLATAAVAVTACGGRAPAGTLEVQWSGSAGGSVIVQRGSRIVLQAPLRELQKQLPPGRYYVGAAITHPDPVQVCRGRFVTIHPDRRTSVAVVWQGGPNCSVQAGAP